MRNLLHHSPFHTKHRFCKRDFAKGILQRWEVRSVKEPLKPDDALQPDDDSKGKVSNAVRVTELLREAPEKSGHSRQCSQLAGVEQKLLSPNLLHEDSDSSPVSRYGQMPAVLLF